MWRAPAIRPASHSWASRTSISCASWARRSASACSGVTSRSAAIRTHRIEGDGPHRSAGAIHTDGGWSPGDHGCMSKSLAAVLASFTVLAGAAPALGSSFTAPRTLANWGPGAEVLVAAPGAAVWNHPTGVRVSRAGQHPVRIPGSGLAQELAVG